MALLQLHFTIAASSSTSTTTSSLLSSISSAVTLDSHHPHCHRFSRFCKSPFAVYPKPNTGCRIDKPFSLKETSALIAKASSTSEGADSDGPESPSESEEENVPIQNLPLESKLQLKLEQKMKMKLAKKIRLRRKKLVRKRRLRKKGRWPPSKLKKNKNV